MEIKVQYLAASIVNRSYGYTPIDEKELLRGLLADPWYDWAYSRAMEEGIEDYLQQHSPSHVIARLWNLYLDDALGLDYPFSWIIRMGGFEKWNMLDIFLNWLMKMEL